jgi:hypothetical protein
MPPVRGLDFVSDIKIRTWLGTVIQACNPSYVGGRNQDNQNSRPNRAKIKNKNSPDAIATNKKLGMVA